MDATLKAQWVEALRSGKYQQGYGALRKGDQFCCLGVLCDVAQIGDWHLINEVEERYAAEEDDEDGTELSPNARRSLRLSADAQEKLIHMNDGAKDGDGVYTRAPQNFAAIAAYIQESL